MLNLLARSPPTASLRRPLSRSEAQLVNARPIYWLLRCSIRLCLRWFAASRLRIRTDNSGRPIARRHSLTLMSYPRLARHPMLSSRSPRSIHGKH